MICRVGSLESGGNGGGGWCVEFHSCVDICMMRLVVVCMHGGRGRRPPRLLQAVKCSVGLKGIVSVFR